MKAGAVRSGELADYAATFRMRWFMRGIAWSAGYPAWSWPWRVAGALVLRASLAGLTVHRWAWRQGLR